MNIYTKKYKNINEYWQLLLIYVVIGAIFTGSAAYCIYQDKKIFWQEQACITFIQTINSKILNRYRIEVFNILSEPVDFPKKRRRPIIELVKKKYHHKRVFTPQYKHHDNVEKQKILQELQSMMFKIYPLNVDSLNYIWEYQLTKMGFEGKSMVLLSITDSLNHKRLIYSKKSIHANESDSLISCGIGSRSEIEITGFIDCPWWKFFSFQDIFFLFCIITIWFLLFLLQKKGILNYRKTVKSSSLIFIEKDIFSKKTEDNIAHIYQLETGVWFDVGSKIVKNQDIYISINSQSTMLLLGFLEAKEYRLSIEEIYLLLWPKGNGSSSKMHMAISRLRKSLQKVSGCKIENSNYGYLLKISISSNGFNHESDIID